MSDWPLRMDDLAVKRRVLRKDDRGWRIAELKQIAVPVQIAGFEFALCVKEVLRTEDLSRFSPEK